MRAVAVVSGSRRVYYTPRGRYTVCVPGSVRSVVSASKNT